MGEEKDCYTYEERCSNLLVVFNEQYVKGRQTRGQGWKSSKSRVSDLKKVLSSPIADWADLWSSYDRWPAHLYNYVSEAWLCMRIFSGTPQNVYLTKVGWPQPHSRRLAFYALRHIVDLTKTDLQGKKSKLHSMLLKGEQLLSHFLFLPDAASVGIAYKLYFDRETGALVSCAAEILQVDKQRLIRCLQANDTLSSELCSILLDKQFWGAFHLSLSELEELSNWLKCFLKFCRKGEMSAEEVESLLPQLLGTQDPNLSKTFSALKSPVARDQARLAVAAELYEWFCQYLAGLFNLQMSVRDEPHCTSSLVIVDYQAAKGEFGECTENHRLNFIYEDQELDAALAGIVDRQSIAMASTLAHFRRSFKPILNGKFSLKSIPYATSIEDYFVFDFSGSSVDVALQPETPMRRFYHSVPVRVVNLDLFGTSNVESLKWLLHTEDLCIRGPNVLFSKRAWLRYNLGVSWISSQSFISSCTAKSVTTASGTTGVTSSLSADNDRPILCNPTPTRESKTRRRWLFCTFLVTGCIPDCLVRKCAKGRDVEANIAWREKITLFALILISCMLILFYVIGLSMALCPKQKVMAPGEIEAQQLVYAYGRYYDFGKLRKLHVGSEGNSGRWADAFQFDMNKGLDVSDLFYPENFGRRYCPGYDIPPGWSPVNRNRPHPLDEGLFPHDGVDALAVMISKYSMGRVVMSTEYMEKLWERKQRSLVVISNNVYDVTEYMDLGASQDFLGNKARQMLLSVINTGSDSSTIFNSFYKRNPAEAQKLFKCLNGLFYVGQVDYREHWKCWTSNYILLSSSILLAAIIGFKFMAAIQFGATKQPELQDRFVLIQIPCYTEGTMQLEKTLKSCALSSYGSHSSKLLFVVCDGVVIGQGNSSPTPELVLDILGVPKVQRDVTPQLLESVGLELAKLNRAKVYTGYYCVGGVSVPFVVVAKVGLPTEKELAGNRGKRDSQVLLLNFLRRAHLDEPLSPAEIEIYSQMERVLNLTPKCFEFLLMVDADTEIAPDSLNRMVAAMAHDSRLMGLCGDTLLANEKDSWVTMIQVYEYFISHHMSKAFESLFGSVTCLPGCFCMYRIRSPVQGALFVASPLVLEEYAVDCVDTLHMKNLLSLGEDRYLTTLMLKHFSNNKLQFLADAKCTTVAPHEWAVLLSQRRRWINSTVHNLFELLFLENLCGFCCFSMRFIVFLELFSTFVQPAVVVYVIYLCVSVYFDPHGLPVLSLVLIASVYAFQVLLFIFKVEWQHVGWMVVYILAMPIFSLYLPLYSFWHFDDFRWGNTRKLRQNFPGSLISMMTGNKADYTDVLYKAQDTGQIGIPLRSWSEYCQMVEASPTLFSAERSMSTFSVGNEKTGNFQCKEAQLDWDAIYLNVLDYLGQQESLEYVTLSDVARYLSTVWNTDFSVYPERLTQIVDAVLAIK